MCVWKILILLEGKSPWGLELWLDEGPAQHHLTPNTNSIPIVLVISQGSEIVKNLPREFQTMRRGLWNNPPRPKGRTLNKGLLPDSLGLLAEALSCWFLLCLLSFDWCHGSPCPLECEGGVPVHSLLPHITVCILHTKRTGEMLIPVRLQTQGLLTQKKRKTEPTEHAD